MEAIVAAGAVEPQQMIAQQGQLFLLAQCPNDALGGHWAGNFVAHIITPRGSPRGGVESLDHLYCASHHEAQVLIMPNKKSGFINRLSTCRPAPQAICTHWI